MTREDKGREIVKTLKAMLRSKKAVACLIGVIAVLLSEGMGFDKSASTKVAGLIGAYLFGQGLADFGKERNPH